MSVHTLYLCYFGLREPLVQTQVLPYLRQVAAGGVGVSLLTFEPALKQRWTAAQLADERAQLEADGIRWFSLPYHKRPSVPATLYDIVAGAWFAARRARRDGIEILHARTHVPMAMALLARVFGARCRTIFDIRGLVAEEYADAGIWTENSVPFRLVKMLERVGIRRADRIIVLTRRVRDWLVEHGLAPAEKIKVIPCCVDFSRYGGPDGGAGAERFEVVYAGSVVGLYMLEEMARFFTELRARRPGAFFRVLTTSPPEAVAAVLRRADVRADEFSVGSVPAQEVPQHLRRARLGVSFRKPTFSQMAASPTKIPEYLAAGLPVISNVGIGVTDELLARGRVGVLVGDFGRDALGRAADQALALADEPGVSSRCVAVAHKHFDLSTVGGARYQDVYRQLEEQGDAALATSERASEL